MRSQCGKRLFSVQKLRFTLEFPIKASEWVDVAQVKNLTNFQKTR